MYDIGFYAGEGNYPGSSVNYMHGIVEGVILLAEIEIPDECFDGADENGWTNEAEEYGYDELKAEIIRQAEEAGINPNDLKFYWG